VGALLSFSTAPDGCGRFEAGSDVSGCTLPCAVKQSADGRDNKQHRDSPGGMHIVVGHSMSSLVLSASARALRFSQSSRRIELRGRWHLIRIEYDSSTPGSTKESREMVNGTKGNSDDIDILVGTWRVRFERLIQAWETGIRDSLVVVVAG
jgi:hypothetical protein